MDTRAGFFNGKIASALPNTSTQTVGLKTIRISDRAAPTTMLQTAPAVVKPFQMIDISKAGKFALAAIEKANPTMKATFCPLNIRPKPIAKRPRNIVALLATLISPFSSDTPFFTTCT